MRRYAQMTAHVVSRPYRAPEAVMCAGNYSQVHPLLLPRHFHSSALPLLLALYSHACEPGVLLSHTSLLQAIDVWSVGCVFAELYQLFKNDKRSFRPFFYGTIKLGPGEREGGPVAAALCSRIVALSPPAASSKI